MNTQSSSRLRAGALNKQDACMRAPPHTCARALSRRTLSLPQAPVVCLHTSFHTCARSVTTGLKRGHIFTQRPGRLPRHVCAGRHTQAQDPRLVCPTGRRRRHPVSPGLESTLPQGRSKPAPGRASERGRRPDPVQGFPGPKGLQRKPLLKSRSTAIICFQSSPPTPGAADLPAPEPPGASGQVGLPRP